MNGALPRGTVYEIDVNGAHRYFQQVGREAFGGEWLLPLREPVPCPLTDDEVRDALADVDPATVPVHVHADAAIARQDPRIRSRGTFAIPPAQVHDAVPRRHGIRRRGILAWSIRRSDGSHHMIRDRPLTAAELRLPLLDHLVLDEAIAAWSGADTARPSDTSGVGGPRREYEVRGSVDATQAMLQVLRETEDDVTAERLDEWTVRITLSLDPRSLVEMDDHVSELASSHGLDIVGRGATL